MGIKRLHEQFKRISKNIAYQRIEKREVKDIIHNHFSFWSEPDHVNRQAFLEVLNRIAPAPAVIIETGTSAWGTDSTRIWDSYIRRFGGSFHSVDIRKEASADLFGQLSRRTKLHVADSVDFLERNLDLNADVYFLDSWDLDLNDPVPSAEHGMREFHAIKGNLKSGVILFIDDTPSFDFLKTMTLPNAAQEFVDKYGSPPGKGAFVKAYVDEKIKHKVLHHNYSWVIQIL